MTPFISGEYFEATAIANHVTKCERIYHTAIKLKNGNWGITAKYHPTKSGK